MGGDWTAIMPVKRLHAAKSRLRGAVPLSRHADLALAMVLDTATAVISVCDLIVVTDDPVTATAVTELGARVVPDLPGAGLNEAMRYGADEVTGLGRRRAVLAGDLPALRPAEFDAALSAVGDRAFVADAAGTGTVLLGAAAGVHLNPLFGIGSARAHAESGARALEGDWPGLRQDVDTPADLATVLALGAGRHTCALLRDLGLKVACVPAA
ncbi:2-phospho-L-lactate guanylyltransferase [Actinoplanes sp. NPDC048796]|uniref:2-phospho-L-lactate guanylyltransferase n=1 Tax=Actinoplanes sp. NPDC048796 TaxID=3155640 RepID=UPI003404F179